MISAAEINTRMLPEERVEQFARWLQDYIQNANDGVKLDSNAYPEMQAISTNYKKYIDNSVDPKKMATSLGIFKDSILRDIAPNTDGIYEDHLYNNAVELFTLALLYPSDQTLIEKAKKGFDEAMKNHSTQEEIDHLWEKHKASLKLLHENNKYINKERRIAAHMYIIKNLCIDTVNFSIIKNPFLLSKPHRSNLGLRVYDYSKAYLVAPYNFKACTDTDNTGHMRMLPGLEKAMKAFYQELQSDIEAFPNNIPEPIRNFSNSITEKEKEEAERLSEQNRAQPNELPRESHQNTAEDEDEDNDIVTEMFSHFMLFVMFGITDLIATYGFISFARGDDNSYLNCGDGVRDETLHTLTTNGIASALFFGAAVGLLSLCFHRMLVLRQHHHRFHFLPVLTGLLAGAATGFYSAQQIDGFTKPITRAGGTCGDFTITSEGAGYIAGFIIMGAALGYLAHLALHTDRLNPARDRALVLFGRQPANRGNMMEPLIEPNGNHSMVT